MKLKQVLFFTSRAYSGSHLWQKFDSLHFDRKIRCTMLCYQKLILSLSYVISTFNKRQPSVHHVFHIDLHHIWMCTSHPDMSVTFENSLPWTSQVLWMYTHDARWNWIQTRRSVFCIFDIYVLSAKYDLIMQLLEKVKFDTAEFF